MTLREIAYVVVTSLLGDDVDPASLKKVVDSTFTIDIPIHPIDDHTDVYELFHGPTKAFKDFSARFVANFVKQYKQINLPRVAIVATTGNTGAAIASAFEGQNGRHVIILYPSSNNNSSISDLGHQRKNIHLIEVAGGIDKCKKMVKEVVSDDSLAKLMFLTSVNTTNFIRLIPQVVFFFYAYARMRAKHGEERKFCPVIPCGNLSSLNSAIIAKRMGLPMGRIIAGSNSNGLLANVLKSGEVPPEGTNKVFPTLAYAMDTGYPTNLSRLLRLYDNDLGRISKEIYSFKIGDEEIGETIKEVYDRFQYTIDPHTAVAFAALNKARVPADAYLAVMATADPVKSMGAVERFIGETPLSKSIERKPKIHNHKMPPSYAALRKFILSTIKN